MGTMRTLVLFTLALGTAAYGDEIVLKDGTAVAWKVLRDDGDAYVVTTADGRTRRIEKANVIQFRKVESQEPLTGAIFTRNEKKGVPVDLLPKVDPAMAVAGKWRLKEDGSLVSPKIAHGRIVLPVEELGDCDILLRVRRLAGDKALYFGIPIRDHRLFVVFDTRTAERGIGGLYDTITREKTFKELNRSYTIRFIVRSNRFLALVDGKIAIDWRSPDYSIETVPEKLRVRRRGLMIGVFDTVYCIQKLSIMPR